jgi:hypothetical protein
MEIIIARNYLSWTVLTAMFLLLLFFGFCFLSLTKEIYQPGSWASKMTVDSSEKDVDKSF